MTNQTTSRRRFVTLAGGVVLAGTAGCAGPSDATAQDEDEPTETTMTETATGMATETPTATPDAGSNTTIAMVTDNHGSYFDPKGLLVEPGTTVTFVNESGSHNTAAYHPDTGDVPLRIPEDAEPWDSELFSESGSTAEVTLSVPGVYDYYCRPHETLGMVGRIVLGEPQGGPGTTPPEEVSPAGRESLPAVEDIIESGSVAGP